MIPNVIYILIGLIFILGGVLKWINLPVFEFQLVKDGLAVWGWVGFFSRFITGLEIVLGALLVFSRPVRKYTSYAVLLMLIAFTSYLFYSLSIYGSSGNCGCFGEVIPISTESSIVKNIIMAGFLVIAIFMDKKAAEAEWRLPLLTAIIVYSLMFSLTPLRKYSDPAAPVKKEVTTVIDTSSVEAVPKTAQTKTDTVKHPKTPPVSESETDNKYIQTASVFGQFTEYSSGKYNPDDGEKLIALFSLDCEHCLAAAEKMAKQKGTLPQILILFLGEPEQVAPFFEETGLNEPYMILPPEQFFPLLKTSPPRVLLLKRGNVIKEWNGEF